MRNRKFGVEIECGFRGGFNAAVQLLKAGADKGDINPYWWENAGTDGTLLETRSPILRGKSGFAELHRVMNLLTANGGYITTADGMHVHHDAPEYVDDLEKTKCLVRSWVNNGAVIDRFIPQQRRRRYPCPPWPEEYVETLETTATPANFKSIGGMHRYDLNIRSLDRHGTIEIRLHPGCLDPVQAEAWIRFGQAFLNRCSQVKTPIPKVETHEELLKRIRAHQHSKQNLTIFA